MMPPAYPQFGQCGGRENSNDLLLHRWHSNTCGTVLSVVGVWVARAPAPVDVRSVSVFWAVGAGRVQMQVGAEAVLDGVAYAASKILEWRGVARAVAIGSPVPAPNGILGLDELPTGFPVPGVGV